MLIAVLVVLTVAVYLALAYFAYGDRRRTTRHRARGADELPRPERRPARHRADPSASSTSSTVNK